MRRRALAPLLLLAALAPPAARSQEPASSVPPGWRKAPPPGEAVPAPDAAGEAAATPPLVPSPSPPPPPSSAVTTAGDVTVSARVDPEARVGDVIAWEIVVDAPSGAAVSEPAIAAASAGAEVREPFKPVREETAGGRTRRTFVARVAPFDLGAQAVPAAELLVKTAGESERRIPAPLVGTLVRSVLPPGPTPPYKDAKGVVPILGPLPSWVLGALAGLLLALALVYLWKRRRVVLPALPAEPPIPCDERALRDLRALGASSLLREGRVQEYYVRLSEILRAYLGARYGFDGLEMTTDELHRALRDRRVPGTVRDLAHPVTDAADLVKFARHEPQASVHAEALATALRLVEVSRPAPDAAPGRAGGAPGGAGTGAGPAPGGATLVPGAGRRGTAPRGASR